MTANVGERLAAALLAKDWDGVAAVLDPAIDFRGLTPGRPWEANYDADGDKITKLRILCTGFLPSANHG
jgi:hypothetical protein